jgi:hypothetical protein
MGIVQEFLYFAFDAAAALLLVATWQRTRINGFLVLAASYVLGIVARWVVPLLHRGVASDFASNALLITLFRSIWFVIAAVALYGLWDIYRQLKDRTVPAPPVA